MRVIVKVLIWIGAVVGYFVSGLILDIVFAAFFNGLKPGYLFDVALIGLMVFLGKKLSERWELHCRGVDINAIDGKASVEGKTRREYLIEHTPKFIIDICEDNHTSDALEQILKPYVKSGAITPRIAKSLVEEFGK